MYGLLCARGFTRANTELYHVDFLHSKKEGRKQFIFPATTPHIPNYALLPFLPSSNLPTTLYPLLTQQSLSLTSRPHASRLAGGIITTLFNAHAHVKGVPQSTGTG